jgi:hypothetical protein
VEIRAEAKEPAGRSSRSQSRKLISNIATKRRVEALKKDNMVDEVLFPEVEEEEEPEEA